ncbi:hypothetical protein CK510_16875 [Brunnivagina elsteri CCALA 953]|uniref:Uncharacterized protein n=1 Tax=Brunnivagina elsteri CCALA 953 TaxID=987040 RepID=A0A2A2TGY3_9CYAN|nr:hypothetical protein CK510_16875 [Calothrix elsteri CCALA 953]
MALNLVLLAWVAAIAEQIYLSDQSLMTVSVKWMMKSYYRIQTGTRLLTTLQFGCENLRVSKPAIYYLILCEI